MNPTVAAERRGNVRLTERGKNWLAGLALAGLVGSGAAVVLHNTAPDPVTTEFGQRNLSDQYMDPANPLSKSEDVVMVGFSDGDTATNVSAHIANVEDLNQVKEEIGGQTGKYINPGEEVAVIPKDQIDSTMVQPEMIDGEPRTTPNGIPFVEPVTPDK